MATLTYSVTNSGKLLGGATRVNIVSVGMSGSYVSGGETISAANCGMSKVDAVVCTASPGFVSYYNQATAKLQFFESGTTDATLDELNAAALPAVLTNTVQLIVFGR